MSESPFEAADGIDTESIDEWADGEARRDQDGVSSLRDTEAEQGDEEGLDDMLEIDVKEARETGAPLTDLDTQEPRLD
jgi:hypothetical protein